MDCSPIVCALYRIAEELAAPNWVELYLSALLTLLATLVGAGFALWGSWLLARRASVERYRERLLAALDELSNEILEDQAALFHHSFIAYDKVAWTVKYERGVVRTSGSAVRIAEGNDRVVAVAVRDLLDRLSDQDSPLDRYDLLTDVQRVLSIWITSGLDFEVGRDAVDELSAKWTSNANGGAAATSS